MSKTWEQISAELKPKMEAMHLVREQALGQCRAIIQTSARCIRHAHRRQFTEAAELLDQAKEQAKKARETLSPHPSLLYTGYLQDAEKEMVEAAGVLAVIHKTPLPSLDDLGVDLASYLNGMGEAASELRRYVLDEMRKGSLGEAERILNQMESIYDELITFDYADGLTGGLRRTCDALRAVIERTRSDLTMTASQQELLDELKTNRLTQKLPT